jgi:hypothetical protein
MATTELSTKQVRAGLEKTLDAIWRMGDRDECSIKHINHSLAAILARKLEAGVAKGVYPYFHPYN